MSLSARFIVSSFSWCLCFSLSLNLSLRTFNGFFFFQAHSLSLSAPYIVYSSIRRCLRFSLSLYLYMYIYLSLSLSLSLSPLPHLLWFLPLSNDVSRSPSLIFSISCKQSIWPLSLVSTFFHFLQAISQASFSTFSYCFIFLQAKRLAFPTSHHTPPHFSTIPFSSPASTTPLQPRGFSRKPANSSYSLLISSLFLSTSYISVRSVFSKGGEVHVKRPSSQLSEQPRPV